MNPGVRDQIGLELGQIHVESAVEAEGSRDGGDDLADQTIQVRVGRAVNVHVAAVKKSGRKSKSEMSWGCNAKAYLVCKGKFRELGLRAT